jgi:cytochrome c-type biogenesis protein CcmH
MIPMTLRFARLCTLGVLMLGALTQPGIAVQPDERLSDPVQEARARALSRELRCVVCQNQSIDESNADIARDLRLIVRERLVAGDTDGQVLDFLSARYGDYVLLKPPVRPATYLLWFGPAAILLLGGGALAMRGRRRTHPTAAAPLSDEERRRLNALLTDREGSAS